MSAFGPGSAALTRCDGDSAALRRSERNDALSPYVPRSRPGSGPALRRALSDDADRWLRELLDEPGPGVALAAVGSLGRREMAPTSDLDVVLLHRGSRDVATVADRLWYPIWDAGVGLDHSVRTPAEAVAVAREDLKAALGLLDIRHVAVDGELTAELREVHLRHWRAEAARRLPELAGSCSARAERCGELAFLLEPDLKDARGGLRDLQALWQVAAAQRADRPGAVIAAAGELLLDVRGALPPHRSRDRLLLQEQDAVADRLGYCDADEVMAAVAAAGRAIAYALDVTWRAVLPRSAPRARRRFGRPMGRQPLADGVVADDGEVVLALDARPAVDPVLVLRVAAAAARAALPVAPHTWQRLAACPPLPDPWPAEARAALVEALAAGHAAVGILESMDQAGLLVRLLPEWEHTRSRPQRNAYHRFTVDRHLLEAAAHAAAFTRRVRRPDLLLLGALLHDIGKGLPGDHTEAGVRLVEQLGPRLGLDETDAATLARLVGHHLLLADVAQRRDLEDPATVAAVAAAFGDRQALELLAALTEADSMATGPAAWSTWKAALLLTLVRRVLARLDGEPLTVPPLTDRQAGLLAGRTVALAADGDEIDVACPDRPGLLATVAGVLALHRLEIRSLSARTDDGFALVAALAHPRFGRGPDWSLLRADLARALDDPTGLPARVAERAAAYPPPAAAAAAQVHWVPEVASSPPGVADVVSSPALEVRAPDGLGVLHRIAAAMTAAGTDVRSARCQTLGADVVDSFTVRPLTEHARARISAPALAAMEGPQTTA